MAVVGSNVAPLPQTKTTRQWDAWTREEEENFFGALRQVGKNFEKITSRVQSKNKDQVRHYYYRVIKRMNRILAPNLILDAKNSTHVNNAMLRWWSLLEKHPCTAAKLRLKPRRFKMFVNALEHQLLKDHKKGKTKKPTSSGSSSRKHGAYSDAASGMSSGLPSTLSSNGSGELQTVSSARRAAVKRKAASNGPRKALPKGEAKRPPRPRKKPTDGNLSKGAYAKWEKAASVGVSLVAEAAEQLERGSEAGVGPAASVSEPHSTPATGSLINLDLQTGNISPSTSAAFAELGLSDKMANELPSGREVQILGPGGVPVSSASSGVARCTSQAACISAAMPVPALAPNGVLPNIYGGGPGGLVIIPELCAQVKAKSLALDTTRCNNCRSLRCSGPEEGMNGAKLQLQLFPIDIYLRNALEQDGLNPHLELTLNPTKRVPSVLKHLVLKWGRSTVASGDLRLFPFSTNRSNVSVSQSWSSQDLDVNAADVHAALGNPAVFRLRYAWLSNRVLESSPAVLQQQQRPADCVSVPVPGPRPESVAQQISVPGPRRKNKQMSVPGPRRENIAKQISVALAPTSRSACDGGSTVMATEVRRKPEQIRELSNEDARQGVAPVLSACDVPRPFPSRLPPLRPLPPSVRPVIASERPVVGKLPGSSGAPDVTFGSDLDKEVALGLDQASVAQKRAGGVEPSKCRVLERETPISGCAWLYESNDGFAQDLWTPEDTLRSSSGFPMNSFEWCDSLTDISATDMQTEALRAVCSAETDGFQPSTWNAQATSLDSFGIAITSQLQSLPSNLLVPGSLFGGEDTCDAFSFERSERSSQEIVSSMAAELSGDSLCPPIMLPSYEDYATGQEGDSLMAFDLTPPPQHCQSEDLLFDGETSLGLGGIIEALAHKSLDDFPLRSQDGGACDEGTSRCRELTGRTREPNEEIAQELTSTDGVGRVPSSSFRELARIEANGNSELMGRLEKMPEAASLPSINSWQVMESLCGSGSVSGRLARTTECHQQEKPFDIDAKYRTPLFLTLQG